MRQRRRLSKELRKAIGNSLFAVSSAIVIFLLVDSRFDESKSLDAISVIIYSALVVLMLLCGGIILNSIHTEETDKLRYIRYNGVPPILTVRQYNVGVQREQEQTKKPQSKRKRK